MALLVSLKDLQTARDSGAVDAEEYLRLREDTESRMAKVLRAIDERRRREEAGPDPDAPRVRRSPTRYIAIAMVAAIALSVGLVPSLLRSLHDRTTNDLTARRSRSSRRVFASIPHDVAARLDLGHRLPRSARAVRRRVHAVHGGARDPAEQRRRARELRPAGAPLGRPAAGPRRPRTRRSQIDPTYGAALFYKGTILLKGLGEPRQAIVYLQRYLVGNPTGSYGDTARQEIAAANAELASGTPTPSAPASPPVPSPRLTVPSN